MIAPAEYQLALLTIIAEAVAISGMIWWWRRRAFSDLTERDQTSKKQLTAKWKSW